LQKGELQSLTVGSKEEEDDHISLNKTKGGGRVFGFGGSEEFKQEGEGCFTTSAKKEKRETPPPGWGQESRGGESTPLKSAGGEGKRRRSIIFLSH